MTATEDNPASRRLTSVEQAIADIWSDILGVQEISPHDTFAVLGGHSLLALQVLWRLQDQFRIELPLRSVFEAATLGDLARVVGEATAGRLGASIVASASRGDEIPLSAAQEQYWFFGELVPDQPVHNVPHALMLEGELDVESLERALRELVLRHEVLRTRFAVVEGRPRQVIDATAAIDIREVALGAGTDDGHELVRLVREEVRRPFDLAAAPLLRVLLIARSPVRHILLVTMHHIIIDGWSVQILLHELAGLYKAFHEGTTPTPATVAPQYVDYAVWERTALGSAAMDEQLSYWRERLANLPGPLKLPFAKDRQGQGSYHGAIHHFTIPAPLVRELRQLADQRSATMFMTLLAGFQATLFSYTGATDICIGTPAAGRVRKETETIVGPFVNVLVMRGDLAGDPPFSELLRATRGAAIAAYAHQEVPFQRLVRELRPARDLSRNPLVQILFWVLPHRLTNSEWDWGNLSASTFRVEGTHIQGDGSGAMGTAQMDLTILVREQGDELCCSIRYRDDLFERGAVEEMAGRLTQVLRNVAQAPDQPLSSLVPAPPRSEERLSPRDTERMLRELAGVADVAVLPVRTGPAEDEVLVAYVTGAGVPGLEELRAHLTERLPAPLVPSSFFWLPALPVTPTGALDLAALPAPMARFGQPAAYVPPCDGTEKVVAEIWSELLGRPQIGAQDGFFELGGYSILAMEALWRIEQELGVRLPIVTFFEAPSLARLAEEIERAATAELHRRAPVSHLDVLGQPRDCGSLVEFLNG
jgi:acyl carrier protein